MTQRIEFEGVTHEFPDDFGEADISTALNAPLGLLEVRRGRGLALSLQRIWERLGESGQAVIDLPAVTGRALTGQGTKEDIFTALRALGAPFEPLFAPIGESIRTSAEEFGASPETAELIGAATEMGTALTLPFVPTKPTPIGRGLQAVGIGRTPEATLQAERAIELGQQAARVAPKDVTTILNPPETLPPGVATQLETPPTPRIEVSKATGKPSVFAREIDELVAKLPPEKPETIRLYRGEPKPGTPEFKPGEDVGRFFSSDPNDAIFFSQPQMGERQIRFIDVPIEEAGKYRIAAGIDDYKLPKALAEKASIAPGRAMMTAEQALQAEQTITKALPMELQGARLSTETTAKITKAAEAVFKEAGIARDPELPVTIQIVKALHEQPGAFAALKTELQAAGVSLEDFAQAFTATGSSAGRQLNQLAQLSQRMQQIPELAELSNVLAKAQPPLTGWEVASHFWGRFVNLWRGSLVAQWSTAVRNLTTQSARMGLENIELVTDVAIRNVTKTGTAADRQLTPALRGIMESWQTMVSREKLAEVNTLLESFPKESTRLFQRFSSDVTVSSRLQTGELGGAAAAAEKAFDKAERALNMLNFLNKGQEFLVRRSAFRAKLAELLSKKGLDINTVAPVQIAAEDIAKSVDHSLEMTWALSPKGGPAKAFMDLYNNPIGKALSFFAPFPRFMYNAWKFQFEYSPAAFLKLLSTKERAAIAAGNVRTLSRALVGSGLYYAAWEIRNNPDIAGERWYEIKIDDRRLDVRPFAPFVFPLFVAEVVKLASEGKEMELRDVINGVAASQFRAGAGLYILDEMQNFVSELLAGGTDLEPATRKARRFIGEIAGGFATPLNTFRELYADYGRLLGERMGELAAEEAKLREVREEPLLGPAKRRIPFVSQTLPEKELPLTAATPTQQAIEPEGIRLSRQLTGLSIQTRTALEAEFNRLGLRVQEIMPRTGEPKADRLILKYMGPIAERGLAPMLNHPGYVIRTDAERRVILTEALSAIREGAAAMAFQDDPALFTRLKLTGSFRPRMRQLLIERGALPREFK